MSYLLVIDLDVWENLEGTPFLPFSSSVPSKERKQGTNPSCPSHPFPCPSSPSPSPSVPQD
jgi:hypothetical protein